MTITKRPTAARAVAIDKFIGCAPDAATGVAGEPVKRRKETISLGIDPVLLKRIDALAIAHGISRAAAISLAMTRLVETDGRSD